MRKAASCCHPLHESIVPRGAYTVRGPCSCGVAEGVGSELGIFMELLSFPLSSSNIFYGDGVLL